MKSTALAYLLLTLCLGLQAESLPKIAVLSTGGTIASKHNPAKGGYEPALTGEALVDAIPEIRKLAQIEVEQISNISSSDVTPAIWLQLGSRAKKVLERSDVAGVVITHGTNTLEETAYFLDLTIDSTKPVVLVGAQRPASDPDSDGPRNLKDAIRVVLSREAIGKGVLVVMNGQINAARDVTKTNTSQVETFRSLEFGPPGVVDETAVRFYRAPLRRQTLGIAAQAKLPRVEVIMNYAGADGALLRAVVQSGTADAFVVAGLGLGGVPSPVFDVIEEARQRNIPVVISTRVPTGRVFPLSATKGSPLALQRIGCILADNLSPQKARVLLMVALTRTNDPRALQNYFAF